MSNVPLPPAPEVNGFQLGMLARNGVKLGVVTDLSDTELCVSFLDDSGFVDFDTNEAWTYIETIPDGRYSPPE